MTHKHEAYDLATQIKSYQGSAGYLDSVAKKLAHQLIERRSTPEILLVKGTTRRVIQTRIQAVPTMTTRRLRARQLREKFPQIYAAHVTELPPVNRYQITLARGTGRGQSEEWAAAAALGAEKARAHWDKRYRNRPAESWGWPGFQAEVLHDVREAMRFYHNKEAELRTEFSEKIAVNGWPLRIPGMTDGVIRATTNGPRLQIDYDALEADLFGRKYITRSTTQGYEKVTFHEVRDNDPDEGDAEAFEGD